MKLTNELKRCHFCGNVDVYTDSALGQRQVRCDSCEACGPTGDDDEDAIAAWNRLASPVAADAAAPTLLGSPAEGHWGEPETPSDGHKLESDVDEEAQPDERAAFEAKFPVPGGVDWDGTKYVVRDGYENSYPVERFGGQWEAWQARATEPQATVRDDGCRPGGCSAIGCDGGHYCFPRAAVAQASATLTREQIEKIWRAAAGKHKPGSLADALEFAEALLAAQSSTGEGEPK